MKETADPKTSYPDYSGILGDSCLERRALELWSRLSSNPSSTVRQLASNSAEQKAYY
ncbi:MAG: hypothetical protein WBA61_13855 [Aequorivita sp.]